MHVTFSVRGNEEEMFLGMLGFLMILCFALLAFAIVAYVLESLGAYTIAKRRGIHHPWLAWIPVGQAWIWGCLSDQYAYVARGQVHNRRKILLGLTIAGAVISSIVTGLYGGIATRLITLAEDLAYMTDEEVMNLVLPNMLQMMAVVLVAGGVCIATTVIAYMALYDIYRSCNPNNAGVFLVLSILVSVTEPFLLFSCRNKDLGMPPRKPAPPAPVWTPGPGAGGDTPPTLPPMDPPVQ